MKGVIRLIKKILLGVVILGAIAVAFVGYGTYKVADEALKEKEPQLRQYLTLDETAQNKYILENVDELLAKVDLDKDGKPEEKEQLERIKQLNATPEFQKALVEMVRSFMATAVLMSDSISKDLPDDTKDKYQKESDQLEARLDKYSKMLEAAGIK